MSKELKDASPTIFAPTRRDLFRMTRDTALVALLGACAPEVSSPSTPEPTSSPIATLRSPNTSPSRAPATLQPEKIAQVEAFGIWWHILSSTQKKGEDRPCTVNGKAQWCPYATKELRMEILNPSVWKNTFDEKGGTGIIADDPLRVRWRADYISPDEKERYSFLGEIQLAAIKATALPAQLSEVDKQVNHLKWKGSVVISFIRQARAAIGKPSITFSDLPPNFSQWEEERPLTKLDVGLREDGGLVRLNTLDHPHFGGLPMLEDFEIPSETMLWDRSLGPCAISPDPYCRRVSK